MISLSPTVAMAVPPSPIDNTAVLNAEGTGSTDSSFKARIVVNSDENTQVIDVTDAKATIDELLSARGLKSHEYRIEGDHPLVASRTLENNENLVLYKHEIAGTSSTVTLPAPEITQNSDDLYVGETKVENEGAAGEALKTVISTQNRAKAGTETASEEKLTVLTAPIPKVVLVGTKERPKETTTTEPAATSNEPTVNEVANTPGRTAAHSSNTNSSSGDKWGRNTDDEKRSLKASNVDNATIQMIIDQVGKPYVWGASGPNAFDCSGLVYWAYHTHNGKNIPRIAHAQGLASTPVSKDEIQPGDILWTSAHIGIYVGNGKVVHAANPRRGVVITDLNWFLKSGFKIGRL